MPSNEGRLKALEKLRDKEQADERHRAFIENLPKHNRIREQFPDEGPFHRGLYPRGTWNSSPAARFTRNAASWPATG